MTRPCFLVIDREYTGVISSRKLVIETAKLNVSTAYSAAEAIATLERFPGVDGIVLDSGVQDMPCGELIKRLRALRPSMPIVVIGSPSAVHCDADHYLESFHPVELLALLQKLVPEAERVRQREQAGTATEG